MVIENKKIFITGGAGFIANALISRLIDNNKIIVYDNFSRDTLTNSGYANHKNITIIKGDVLDYERLCQSMKNADIVVHAAAITGIDTVKKSPSKTMKVNIIGTANALEAAKENKIKDRFVAFSSSEVFGNHAFKSSENDYAVAGSIGEARWVYGVSKLACEHLSFSYFKEFGLPVVIIRTFNIYGPGQTGDSAMRAFINIALNHEDISIYGDGTQIRAWCYIDDFIDALLLCMESPKAVGESFNIGNSKAVITIYGLAQLVCRVLDSKSNILFKPASSSDIELRIPSVQKAFDILEFEAKTSLEEGILKTAEWFKNNYMK